MPHSDIHFEQTATAGLVTLDRPDALNALTMDMVLAFADQLSRWARDESVTHLLLCSSSPRAFCAGGDIKYARQLAISGDPAGAEPYFRAEYLADIALIEFGKPVIALCDGIVMGGGGGLAQHSQHIVMTETTRFAMPESAIGLFPDVGASLFLGRCPKSVARLMGMTGHVVGAADCLLLGLATAYVPSASLIDLKEKLLHCHVDQVYKIIKQFQIDTGQSLLSSQRQLIDHIFGDGSVESMRDRAAGLAENMPHNKLLGAIVKAFETRCPLSIKLFDRLLFETNDLTDPIAAIELDFHLALRMTKRADFAEGIRAVVLDKDQAPQWTPNSLEAVTETMLDAVFDRSGLPSLR
ncbi:MAG: enoyl-CoA hydratase/isomerase family protein [Proteobacteria bacterium]|nr:enoyl-CoA hydratase/isomerase family protein [Pseudomonadota bacterium]MDA0845210.1 enoyl-CoA hydratase/isomerase family protein [Pseudomonadota bacterium]